MARDKTYVNAICRSRESTLLGGDKLSRLLDSDYADCLRLLGEWGYQVAGEDYRTAISTEREKLVQFVKDFAPTDEILCWVLDSYDFFNAEVSTRNAHLEGIELPYLPEGKVKVEEIRKAVAGDKSDTPDYLAKPIKEAVGLYQEDKATGAKISTLFADAYYGHLLSYVRTRVLKRLIQAEIDGKNLSVAIRSGEEEPLFLEGGTLGKEDLRFITKADRAKVERKFAYDPLGGLIRKALAAKEGKEQLVAFEKEAGSFGLRSLESKRYESEGILPFVLYFLYKSAEIDNVRVVMAGKRSGADRDNIKARLKIGYGF